MAGRAPRVRRVRRPGRPLRFAIVAARFNERITERLVQGALEAFRGARLSGDAVDVHWVPGSFELPQAAGHLAATGRYAAIVCVGVVIRGQTPHFEHVARNRGEEAAEAALAMAEWVDRVRHDAVIVRPAKSARAEPRASLSGHPRLLRPRGTR